MFFDMRLALMTGIEIPYPPAQLIIHQPTIKEISFVGEETFFIGIQTLSLNKSMFVEDKKVLDEITNFHIFMMIMNDQSTVDKKEAVKKVFQLIFPNKQVFFTPKSISINGDGVTSTLDEENFEDFQIIIKAIFCFKEGPMTQQAFNPQGAKAKAIAEKLMRGRKKVAEQKGETNVSIFSQYLSILTIGLHISIADFFNLTMYQLFDLMERYSLYINWDIDIRSRLAGGKPDGQPENWMKNIHQ